MDERLFYSSSRPMLPLEKLPGKHPRATIKHLHLLLHPLPLSAPHFLLSLWPLQPGARLEAPAADTETRSCAESHRELVESASGTPSCKLVHFSTKTNVHYMAKDQWTHRLITGFRSIKKSAIICRITASGSNISTRTELHETGFHRGAAASHHHVQCKVSETGNVFSGDASRFTIWQADGQVWLPGEHYLPECIVSNLSLVEEG